MVLRCGPLWYYVLPSVRELTTTRIAGFGFDNRNSLTLLVDHLSANSFNVLIPLLVTFRACKGHTAPFGQHNYSK